jgi:muramidase (phage lysozyme)
MDKTVPKPAAMLLDFIGAKEAPRGYDTVYANHMDRMPKPLTRMTMKEILDQGRWRTRNFGSSACGRYQFMDATLRDLAIELDLKAEDVFTPDYQDRLGLHLLRRRGYDRWIKGTLSDGEFMLNLAKEWASFPVPYTVKGGSRTVSRGQSFYAGDGLNKSLVSAEAVEKTLVAARDRQDIIAEPVVVAAPEPPLDTREVPDDTAPISLWQAIVQAFTTYLKTRSA